MCSVGEAALLRGEPSPVTVIAAGSAVLLSVPRAAFLRAVVPHVAERRAAAAAFLVRHSPAFQGRHAEVLPSHCRRRQLAAPLSRVCSER